MITVDVLCTPVGEFPTPDWLLGIPMTKSGWPKRNTKAGREAYRRLEVFIAQMEDQFTGWNEDRNG